MGNLSIFPSSTTSEQEKNIKWKISPCVLQGLILPSKKTENIQASLEQSPA